MKDATWTETFHHTWTEDVYNETTDNFEEVTKQAYITVEIETWAGEPWSELSGASPSGTAIEIIDWDGDDIEDMNESAFLEFVYDNI